jgi:hypothetical protein
MSKPRRFSLDLAADEPRSPDRGDVLAGPRAAYRIIEARPVESRIWCNRWALTVERIGSRDDLARVPPEEYAYVWDSTPYRRGEGPSDVFGAAA